MTLPVDFSRFQLPDIFAETLSKATGKPISGRTIRRMIDIVAVNDPNLPVMVDAVRTFNKWSKETPPRAQHRSQTTIRQ